ncbi:MAG: TonB-dependent receptor, partial [Pseudomonadota bacterium]
EIEEDSTTDVFSVRGESFVKRWTFNYDIGLTRSEVDTIGYTANVGSTTNTDILNLLDDSSYVVNPDNNGVDRVVDGVVRFVGDQIPELALSPAGRSFTIDPNTYSVTSVLQTQRTNETENLSLRFKAQHDFAGERLRNVKFGVQYNDIERLNSDDRTANTVPTSFSYVRLFPTRQFLSEFSGDPLFTRNLGAIGAGDTLAAFLRPGMGRSLFDQVAAFEAANPGSYRVTDNLIPPEQSSGAISSAKTTEEILAAFIQGEVALGDFTVTGGVRFEVVDYVGSAINAPLLWQNDGDNDAIDRTTLVGAGLISIFDNTGKTEKVLPSLVATWRPSEQWVGRFAYNRTIFNPSLIAINRPLTIIVDQRENLGRNFATIREGNPDLEQTVNDNFELGIEYYFPNRPAYAKAAVFYKDIKDNLTNVTLADRPGDVEGRIREFLQPLAADFPDLIAGLTADTEYLLQRPENGEGGQIHGIEVEGAINLDFFPESFPRFLDNVQLLANVTWTDAEFPTIIRARNEDDEVFDLIVDRPLEEQSEWAGNFSIAYETGGFSGRLLYTYQSERVDLYDEFNLNNVIPDIKTLDLISTYNFEVNGARYTLFLEADNLLEGRKDALVQRGIGSFGGEGSPDFFFPTSLLFDGGRTFTFGVKAAF